MAFKLFPILLICLFSLGVIEANEDEKKKIKCMMVTARLSILTAEVGFFGLFLIGYEL
jgi:hypothetical protein